MEHRRLNEGEKSCNVLSSEAIDIANFDDIVTDFRVRADCYRDLGFVSLPISGLFAICEPMDKRPQNPMMRVQRSFPLSLCLHTSVDIPQI